MKHSSLLYYTILLVLIYIYTGDNILTFMYSYVRVGNTLLFILAGLIIGRRSILYLRAIDVPYLLVVYTCVFVLRLVMLLISFPLLARLGKPLPICVPPFIQIYTVLYYYTLYYTNIYYTRYYTLFLISLL